MKNAIPFILTTVMLCGVIFGGPAAAGEPPAEQAVFFVQ